MKSLAPDVEAFKNGAAASMNACFQQLRPRIEEELKGWVARDPQRSQAEYDKYLSKVTEQEIQGFVDHLRGQRSLPNVSFRSVPCTSAFVAYALARAKRNLKTSKGFEASATRDWDHFTYAAVPAVLVTRDTDLAKTAELIQAPLVAVQSPEQLFGLLRAP